MTNTKMTDIKFHCKRPYIGNIVDVRDYIIEKVKKRKCKLIITCDGLSGSMTMNYNEIDDKIKWKSREIQSKLYKKNTYKLISFTYEDNSQICGYN